MKEPVIKTVHVYPPIPIRRFDWCAYEDGTEEYGPIGWGETESAALLDLIEQQEEEMDKEI